MKLAAPVRHGCTLARLARPFWATSSCSPVREHRDSIPEGAGPAGQPSHIFHRRCACPAPPLQWDGGDGGTMANDDIVSKRSADADIRYSYSYTIDLRCRAVSDRAIDRVTDDTASTRSEKMARANERYTINLRRAIWDLVTKMKRAYEQPAGDATELRSRHVFALLAIASFLDRMGPIGDLAHFADQLIKLAQELDGLDEGIRAPSL